jgi:hypothetical protein
MEPCSPRAWTEGSCPERRIGWRTWRWREAGSQAPSDQSETECFIKSIKLPLTPSLLPGSRLPPRLFPLKLTKIKQIKKPDTEHFQRVCFWTCLGKFKGTYCPARWIRPKLGSFDRSSLKREARKMFRKIRPSPILWERLLVLELTFRQPI